MNGILAWLSTQAHIIASVIMAVASNQRAPARQVVIYMTVLIALVISIPKIMKLVSK